MDGKWRPLCHIQSLKNGESKAFNAGEPDADGTPLDFDLFVAKVDGSLSVFQNRCPHLGIRLEWQVDQFLDIDGYFIQCATHGALFRSSDGYCISGPCAGDALQAVPFKVENGLLSISAP